MFTNIINMVASYISLRPILSYLSCPLNNHYMGRWTVIITILKEITIFMLKFHQICISLPENFAGAVPLALCLTKNADVI